MPNRKRHSGFTLVELLVVIGIITLLISMLLPALNRARESAQSATCASNLRQIGTMFANYVADHQGWLPPLNSKKFNAAGGGYNPSAINTRDYGMFHALGTYMGKPEWTHTWRESGGLWWPYDFGANKREFLQTIFVCPTYRLIASSPEAYRSGYAESTWLVPPYGWGGGSDTVWGKPRRASRITDPTRRIHVAEIGINDWHISEPKKDYTNRRLDIYRHNNGMNFLFADGHVAWFSGKHISSHFAAMSSVDYVID